MDFINNPGRIFLSHEISTWFDPSMATKLTVQFNLFGGTILKLGSKEQQKELLAKIDNLEAMGCFALTELGYGNNAIEMETRITYEIKHDEFIINTPSPLGQKYWITNGTIHAKWAIVFGQLYIFNRY